MIDIIVGLLIAAMAAAAITYIVRAKKRGVKCIGCPAAGSCCHAKSGGCSEETGSELKNDLK